MSESSSRWEPGSHAVHRLIQLLDVLAIALNRFRQRSFQLPHHNPPHQFDTAGWQEGCSRLRGEFDPVRDAFIGSYVSAARRAERLADEAIAEFARSGARDEATRIAVAEAANWLGLVGTSWQVGKPRPWNYGCYNLRYSTSEEREAIKQADARFEGEGRLLIQCNLLRRGLLSALACVGQTVPPEIDRRAALVFHAWPQGGTDPITQEELLDLVRETEPSAAPSPPRVSDTPPARPDTHLSELAGVNTVVGSMLAKAVPPTPASAPPNEVRQDAGEKPPTASVPGWTDMGEAKRTILIVLKKANRRMQGRAIAKEAGYKYGTLRHHFGELQVWNYIDKTKGGYALTPTGAALVSCERV